MPYGPRRGWSDAITGRQARELHAAAAFASEVGRPLVYRIHINWNRTALGDDATGAAGAAFRQRLARWLRDPEQDGGPLHAIYVRERPSLPAPKPNDHLHLHLPRRLFAPLVRAAPALLPAAAHPFEPEAIVVDDAIGRTERARDGALTYLLKGIAPGAARHINIGAFAIRPEPQGRVQGKRVGVTETLGPAARARQHRDADACPRACPPGSPSQQKGPAPFFYPDTRAGGWGA